MADEKRRLRRFPLNSIRQQEFYATAKKLRTERAAAPKILDAALRDMSRDEWRTLAERPELLTCGMSEHLDTLISQELTRNPKLAEALAALATSVAEGLAPDTYPAVVLAQTKAIAWKSLGNVLSALARYPEALNAYAEAEKHIEDLPTLAHDRAIIRLNVAITHLDTNRLNEALGLLVKCKEVFLAHADTNLFVLSGFYEGLALQRMKKYREARETYLLLIASASDIKTGTLAALHQTVGLCSTEIGDFKTAETHLQKAIALHSELNEPLNALRDEHGRGVLLLRRKLLHEGITHLRSVRHRYLKASLAEEAGLCGLEIVAALLEQGKPDHAEALARTIMNEFLAASLNSRAVTALGYLSEAIAERTAAPSLATDVREYVLSLRRAPEREFVVPAS